MLRSILRCACLLALAVVAAPSAGAQTGDHDVTVVVPLARVFDVGDEDVTLAFATPMGGAYAPVTATSDYDISVSLVRILGLPGTYKITGHLSSAYDPAIEVSVEMQAPGLYGFFAAGTSTGEQVLPAGAANAVALVTGIRWVNGRNRRITYTGRAQLTAPAGVHTRTAIYTIASE